MNNKQKKTLVIGGSTKPERYSNKAIRLLRRYGHPVSAIGLREGKVLDVDIRTDRPDFKDIHTVTMYVGPRNQPAFYDYILGLQPERIIFNPGTENHDFEQLATGNDIEVVNHCTLIMLNEDLF